MSEQIIGAGKEEGNTYEDDFVRRNLNDLKRQISRLTQLAELEIPEKINGLNIRLEAVSYTHLTLPTNREV